MKNNYYIFSALNISRGVRGLGTSQFSVFDGIGSLQFSGMSSRGLKIDFPHDHFKGDDWINAEVLISFAALAAQKWDSRGDRIIPLLQSHFLLSYRQIIARLQWDWLGDYRGSAVFSVSIDTFPQTLLIQLAKAIATQSEYQWTPWLQWHRLIPLKF